MIITRHLINSNIQYSDCEQNRSLKSYNFSLLSTRIDAYKNLLQNQLFCKRGERILIGCQPGLAQTALIFAASELGLVITVVDFNRIDNWKTKDYIDPKTKLLSPINYLFTDTRIASDKLKILQIVSKIVIYTSNNYDSAELYINHNKKIIPLDFTKNDEIFCEPDSTYLICTSSGTTGTPKIISHSHKFIFHLIKRNQFFYSGKVGVSTNLQHGSSFATYFLPIITCNKVTEIYNYKLLELRQGNYTNIEHLMLPYPHLIEQFLYREKGHPNITVYTLSYIQEQWKKELNKNVKNIISFFGSNETSGPVFINELADDNFQETKYKKIDDFYDIKFGQKGELSVTLPHYDSCTISTNDCFIKIDEQYIHTGRNDLIRINGVAIDLESYNKVCKQNLDATLVYDSVKQQIYLAIWKNTDNFQDKIDNVNNYLQESSQYSHLINKYSVLNYEEFLSGIKLDHELLREYFRKNV